MCRYSYLGPSKRRCSVKSSLHYKCEDNAEIYYLTEPLILAYSVSKAIGIKKKICITEKKKTYLETLSEYINSVTLQLTQSNVLGDRLKTAFKGVDLSQVFLESWLRVENVPWRVLRYSVSLVNLVGFRCLVRDTFEKIGRWALLILLDTPSAARQSLPRLIGIHSIPHARTDAVMQCKSSWAMNG